MEKILARWFLFSHLCIVNFRFSEYWEYSSRSLIQNTYRVKILFTYFSNTQNFKVKVGQNSCNVVCWPLCEQCVETLGQGHSTDLVRNVSIGNAIYSNVFFFLKINITWKSPISYELDLLNWPNRGSCGSDSNDLLWVQTPSWPSSFDGSSKIDTNQGSLHRERAANLKSHRVYHYPSSLAENETVKE